MRCVSVRSQRPRLNGSVVPVLQKQLRNNQQLTVTHPEIGGSYDTREQCPWSYKPLRSKPRDTLVLDMGRSVRILDLARTLFVSQANPRNEVSIKFTGLREARSYSKSFSMPEVYSPLRSRKSSDPQRTPPLVRTPAHLEELEPPLASMVRPHSRKDEGNCPRVRLPVGSSTGKKCRTGCTDNVKPRASGERRLMH